MVCVRNMTTSEDRDQKRKKNEIKHIYDDTSITLPSYTSSNMTVNHYTSSNMTVNHYTSSNMTVNHYTSSNMTVNHTPLHRKKQHHLTDQQTTR